MTIPRTRIQWTTEERGKIVERAAYLLRSNPRLKWPELIGMAQSDVLPAERKRKFVQQFAKKEFSAMVAERVKQLRAGVGQIPDQTQITRKVEFVHTSPPATQATVTSPPPEVSVPKSAQDVSLSEFFRPTVEALGKLYYDQLVSMLEVELKKRTEQALKKAKNEIESQLNVLVEASVKEAFETGKAGKDISAISAGGVTAIPPSTTKPKIRVAYVGDVTGAEFASVKADMEEFCHFVLVNKPAKVKSATHCPIVIASNKVTHSMLDSVWAMNKGCVKIMERSAATAHLKLMETITSPSFKA